MFNNFQINEYDWNESFSRFYWNLSSLSVVRLCWTVFFTRERYKQENSCSHLIFSELCSESLIFSSFPHHHHRVVENSSEIGWALQQISAHPVGSSNLFDKVIGWMNGKRLLFLECVCGRMLKSLKTETLFLSVCLGLIVRVNK